MQSPGQMTTVAGCQQSQVRPVLEASLKQVTRALATMWRGTGEQFHEHDRETVYIRRSGRSVLSEFGRGVARIAAKIVLIGPSGESGNEARIKDFHLVILQANRARI